MMKCKRWIIAILVALSIAVTVVGCCHRRTTVMISTDDLGSQIETKNKYTLVLTPDTMRSLLQGAGWSDASMDELIAAQPQVFCSNGIPFTVKSEFVYTPSATPFFIPMLMPFIIPLCGEGPTTEHRFTIDVVDSPDARATFQKKERSDDCFAIVSPLPFVFYSTAGSFDDEPKDNCKFTRHSYSLGFSHGMESVKKDISVSHSATAYGIAVALKQMEESGQINPAKSPSLSDVLKQAGSFWSAGSFDVTDFHRTDSDSHRYVFSLVSTNMNASVREFVLAKRVLSDAIRSDFAASYPSVDRTFLAVDFIEFEFADGVINGAANVLPLKIISYNYDKHMRKGCMRIKVRADQFDALRLYVRQNVELIARDKNIALIVGETPPGARFYLLDESVDDGVLVVNFKTE